MISLLQDILGIRMRPSRPRTCTRRANPGEFAHSAGTAPDIRVGFPHNGPRRKTNSVPWRRNPQQAPTSRDLGPMCVAQKKGWCQIVRWKWWWGVNALHLEWGGGALESQRKEAALCSRYFTFASSFWGCETAEFCAQRMHSACNALSRDCALATRDKLSKGYPPHPHPQAKHSSNPDVWLSTPVP